MKFCEQTIALSKAKLVVMPVIEVSSNARCALATASCHVRDVMINFATTLSKSEVTTAGAPDTRAVSTRMPLPEGNRNDCILPMLSEWSFSGFSAVIRSCIEYALGGVMGS